MELSSRNSVRSVEYQGKRLLHICWSKIVLWFGCLKLVILEFSLEYFFGEGS